MDMMGLNMKPVWIVDDDESIRWVLEKALARENIPLKSFSSADEVLEAMERETPQVLVSDIRMPGKSGLHLLEETKKRFPHLPIIIMTAKGETFDKVNGLEMGADDYIVRVFVQTVRSGTCR